MYALLLDNIFCYFGSWTGWRPGNGKFTVSDIDPKLCTHISYSFIGLSDTGSVNILDGGDLFPSFINLKMINPNVKLLVSMGGWNQGSEVYSNVKKKSTKYLNKYIPNNLS